MSKKAEGGSKLGRWLGAPVRALSRACDSYVRSMSACAGRMPTHAAAYGGRGGFAPGRAQAASFSSRSRRGGGAGDDDVDELVRALSKRQASGREGVAAASVPVRSRSVAVGRIDEDAPCEFGADDAVRVGGGLAVRRARSVAVGSAGGLAARARAGGGYGAAKKQLAAGVPPADDDPVVPPASEHALTPVPGGNVVSCVCITSLSFSSISPS